MKKRSLLLLMALSCTLVLAGCGSKKEPEVTTTEEEPVIQIGEDTASEDTVSASAVEEETREGMYRSELTNEWTDEAIQRQRPIAVMIDNEKTALPHYGMNQADVVYEMTNSTQNEGVTRFMAIVKDWGNIEQLGSIRSVRPTNLQIAPEWNAVVCHDGGPFYIDIFLKNDFVKHFSGTFSRVNNGKAREFTEYILPGDLDKNFSDTGISTEYDEYYVEGPHYQFASESNPVDLSSNADAKACTHVELPFHHNNPYLDYDESDGLYYYSEYGDAHNDPGDDNKQMSFKNLLIQSAELEQFDEHGYMMFYSVASDREGYYITNGQIIPVTWTKIDDLNPTRYYDKSGNEITINTGKTYVAIVPEDDFKDLSYNQKQPELIKRAEIPFGFQPLFSFYWNKRFDISIAISEYCSLSLFTCSQPFSRVILFKP